MMPRRSITDLRAAPMPAVARADNAVAKANTGIASSLPPSPHIGAHDAAERLPAAAAAKMQRLRDRLAGLRAIAHDLSDRLADARSDELDAAHRVRELEADRLCPPETLAEAQGKHERRHQERARLDARHKQQTEGMAALASLVDNTLQGFLNSVPSYVTLVPHPGKVTANARKGESPTATVERLRAELADLRKQRKLIERAPFKAEEAKKVARDEILRLAAKGKPDCLDLVERGGRIGFAKQYLQQPLVGIALTPEAPTLLGSARGETFDALACLAWLFGNEMLDLIEAEVDRVADDENALDDTEREARLKEIDATMLDLERAEEITIEAAEATGMTMERRADASPVAVLKLREFG